MLLKISLPYPHNFSLGVQPAQFPRLLEGPALNEGKSIPFEGRFENGFFLIREKRFENLIEAKCGQFSSYFPSLASASGKNGQQYLGKEDFRKDNL